MKKIYSLLIILLAMTSSQPAKAQGWPSDYDGVMLQAFYWDSFTPSQWRTLEAQAGDIASYFSLVWVPQSGKAANNPSMGYDPLYWYNQNSSFGNEAELKSMIQTYKSLGTGVIADVVATMTTAPHSTGPTTTATNSARTTTQAKAGVACATSTTKAKTCRTM